MEEKACIIMLYFFPFFKSENQQVWGNLGNNASVFLPGQGKAFFTLP